MIKKVALDGDRTRSLAMSSRTPGALGNSLAMYEALK